MICIYHNKDLDGIASGAIVKLKYPECDLIGWDYGQPIPNLPEDEKIIMVDVTFPLDIMMNLRYRLTVIDHHKSFINEWEELNKNSPYTLNGKMLIGKAACELTWEYLFPKVKTPEWVTLLGMYDTFRDFGTEEWYNLILPFQYGVRSRISTPEEVALISNGNINSFIKEGKIILHYIKQSEAFTCKRNAFEVDFDGLRAICINLPGVSTMTFDSVYDGLKHDIMLAFNYTGSYWSVSLRSKKDHIDCSVIAKKYGGGGHKAAAGFEVQDINQLIKKNE